MRPHTWTFLLVAAVVAGTFGCVERKMFIRSDPPGAPVWLDENFVGVTPLERPFAHYGVRRVRVGPLRNDVDALTYREKEIDWEVVAPWYETFPLDFFFEVLWPQTLVDEHRLPLFKLAPATEEAAAQGEEHLEQVLKEATKFREQALSRIPEEAPEKPPAK